MTATLTRENDTNLQTESSADSAPDRAPEEVRPGRRCTTVPTELGELRLVADGHALVGVYFPEHQPAPPASVFGEIVDPDVSGDLLLIEAGVQLADYAAGRRDDVDLPLAPGGSERARQVWELIAAVPRGRTTTYAALGRAVGVGPRSAGQFVARNPLSLVVPCHRVVASDGGLTGYAGGVDRKRALLEREGALPPGAGKVPAEARTSPVGLGDGHGTSPDVAGEPEVADGQGAGT